MNTVPIEAFGGPQDGAVFPLPVKDVGELDGEIMSLARERHSENEPACYLYRATAETRAVTNQGHSGVLLRYRLIFLGYALEFTRYVETPVQCAACGCQTMAVAPALTEPPFQCPECERVLCWPKK
jgi:hypothetical protein